MTSRRSLFLVLTLTFLCPRLSANKKDAEAAALIEHAKQVSDIRVAGAPAFRLKIGFSIIKEGGSAEKGSYTEVGIPKPNGARKLCWVIFGETQVVAGRKRWLLDTTMDALEYLSDFLSLTNITRFQPESWKPQKGEDRELNGRSMRCLETNPNPWGGRSALCFDKVSGAITAEVRPFQVGTRIGETVCFYNDYEKFGDRKLARSYECDTDKRRILEATVIESAPAPPAGGAFFTPPDGAKESVNCLGPIKAAEGGPRAGSKCPANFWRASLGCDGHNSRHGWQAPRLEGHFLLQPVKLEFHLP